MAQTSEIPEAVLEVIEADGSRRVVRVTQTPFLFGRGGEEGNHLQLADKRISRRCGSLVYSDGNFLMEDRGQRQGIFVNGEQVEGMRALRDGDIITLGAADSFQLLFHTADSHEALPELLSRLDNLSSLEPGARDLRQLSLLLEATALLQSRLPMEELLGAMVDRAISITDADRGVLLETYTGGEGDLKALVARQRGGLSLPAESLAPSQTVITHALELQHGVVEQDLSQAAAALRGAASVVLQRLRTVIAIPLFSLGQVRSGETASVISQRTLLGVLYLDSRRAAAFSNLQRQILDALALEAASVLDNARLVQRERERRRLEQELSIARDIQQALLPRNFEGFPNLQVTGVNRSCLTVGGDYFDLVRLSDDLTSFVIADVCGKGLGAALLTAMFQGSFASMTLGQDAGAFLGQINRYICSHSDVQKYATLFFGIVDREGNVEYINAGHVPPILIRGGQVRFSFEDGCMPVGLMAHAQFRTFKEKLLAGDTLVLMTDGIPEAMNPENEQFGNERLLEAASGCANGTVQEIQAGILKAVEDFTRGAYQSDDLTLLILRYVNN